MVGLAASEVWISSNDPSGAGIDSLMGLPTPFSMGQTRHQQRGVKKAKDASSTMGVSITRPGFECKI
jgi:hypothetical protein